MTVNLSPHAEELIEAARSRGIGGSAEEIVERALESVAWPAGPGPDADVEERRQAVRGMLAFREEYHLALGPGARIQDLTHEGHKY